MKWVCSDCGNHYPKWEGRCRSCGAWNTLAQFHEVKEKGKGRVQGSPPHLVKVIPAAEVQTPSEGRILFGQAELDALFGGGWAQGSVYLLSGEPGVGKSTLLLQLAHLLKRKILYLCGEETPHQVETRARRLGVDAPGLCYLPETHWQAAQPALEDPNYPVVFVDSIQTLVDDDLPHPAGTVTQLRTCAARLVALAKEHGKTILATGHITKSGDVAGPKVLEHLVDGTFLMESEEGHGIQDLRLIRPLKNRFGPTDTAALFTLDAQGLRPTQERVFSAPDPKGGDSLPPGTAFYPHFLGKRIFFSEIEALAVPTTLSLPRRSAEGISPARMARLVAILERWGGIALSGLDLYVNVTGGVRSEDVAMDLSVLAALYSTCRNTTLPRTTIMLGECGLNGRIRTVRDAGARLRELATWGEFTPAGNGEWAAQKIERVADLLALMATLTQPPH